MNKRYIVSLAMGGLSAALAAGVIAPKVLDQLNKDETSKFKKVMNVIGVGAACFATGYMVGTIIDTNENQLRFVEAIQMVGKGEA